MKSVGKTIKKYRRLRKMSQEQLADLSLVYDQVTYLIGCEQQIEEWRQYKATREVRRIRLEQKN